MRLLKELERKIEKLIDNMFAGKFKASVEPVEIASELRKAMIGGKRISIKNTYVPSSYIVELSESDFKEISSLGRNLVTEIESYLEDEARNGKYTTASKIKVKMTPNHLLKQGAFNVVVEDVPENRTDTPLAYIEIEGKKEIVPILKNEITVGRSENCDIYLPFSRVSRNHAKIFAKDDRFYIEDANSSNGIYINNKKVSKVEITFDQKILIADVPIFLKRTHA